MIDLHTHTTSSDGSTSPKELVNLAAKQGLSAIAITDHDTVSGYEEAAEAASDKNIEVIPGIEFGTKYRSSVHILGFFIDTKNEELNLELHNLVKNRDDRNKGIVELMQKDGIEITYEQMKETFGDVIGRPHFAQVLVEKGIVSSTPEAFEKYVGKGMKYWLPRANIPPERCIELIHHAGGISILAHPLEYRVDTDSLAEIVFHCFECGIQGIECLHPSHSASQSLMLQRLARRYKILKTGGSDYHGLDVKPNNFLGMMNVPDEWLDLLRERLLSSN